MRSKFLILIFVCLYGISSNATERYHNSTLKWVYPWASGDFVIGFDTDAPYCSGTLVPKYMYVSVGQNGVTAEGAAKMYAAALTAFALGKQLYIAFDDSTANCYINRMTVSN